jgi:hypothetical protein
MVGVFDDNSGRWTDGGTRTDEGRSPSLLSYSQVLSSQQPVFYEMQRHGVSGRPSLWPD